MEPDPLTYHVVGPARASDSLLTQLVSRLEAATSRLEDIASSTASVEQSQQSNGAAAATSAGPSGQPNAATPPSQPKSTGPPAIEAFDGLINGDLRTWHDLGTQLGGVVAEQAQAAQRAFAAQRQFLLITTIAKKPDTTSSVFMDLLSDTQREIIKVEEIRQANRQSPFRDHLAMVADGLGALGWVLQDSKPADYVAELFGGAQMYGNKVLQQCKEKDPSHVEWVQAFYKLFKSLIVHVKQFHASGIVWAKDGMDPAQALREVKSAASGAPAPPPAQPATSGGAPPPPPPGPPPPAWTPNTPPAPQSATGGNPAGDMNAIFNDLNKGSAVTSGLRKVDPSQMTHKNPALRAQQTTVPTRSDSADSSGRSKSPHPPRKPDAMRTRKPARAELDGNKWIVENFDSPAAPVEISAALTHSILVSRCANTTLRVTGKANAISVDNSPRTALVVDSLVSSVDVIKCPGFALQVLGAVPTVLLDQVDGAQIYLGAGSLATEVFTSKCSAVNLVLPPPEGRGEDADSTECPVPEQIRTFVRGGRVISEIVEHKG